MIQETRQGRVEYRVDKTANIHVPIGKVSFPTEDLLENMAAVMEAIVKARPAGVQGDLHPQGDGLQHHGAWHPGGSAGGDRP